MAQLVRTKPLSDGTGFYGNMYVGENSLADAMLQAGYCSVKPTMNKKVLQGKSGPFGSMGQVPGVGGPESFSDPSMMVPGPPMMGNSLFSGPGERSGPIKGPQRDQRNTVSPLGHQPPVNQQGIGPPLSMNQHPPNMGFPLKIG